MSNPPPLPPGGPQPLPYQAPPPYQGYQGGPACPKCGNPHSKPVGFTWWGGVIGPKVLSHVKCLGCGTAYNGKTGRYNTTGIIIYSVVVLVICVALLVFLNLAGGR